jgi:signal transduction histidine kinase
MADEETTPVDLEITVRKLLEKASVSGRQTPGNVERNTGTFAQNPAKFEKTAHDIRASLNIIIGFTELMLSETIGKINKEQRSSLKDVLDNGKRLSSLSDEMIKHLEAVPENKMYSGIIQVPEISSQSRRK